MADKVKLYAVTINTVEAFEAVTATDERNDVFQNIGAKYAYLDPIEHYEAFLFLTEAKRNKAYEKLRRYFKTTAAPVRPLCVERKYLSRLRQRRYKI